MAAVRAAFKPEFINRLDDVLIFDGLEPGELVRIVDIQLASWSKRLAQRRLQLEVSLPAKEWLAQRGFDPVYGARPLRRSGPACHRRPVGQDAAGRRRARRRHRSGQRQRRRRLAGFGLNAAAGAIAL